jgi:hypothetical protein
MIDPFGANEMFPGFCPAEYESCGGGDDGGDGGGVGVAVGVGGGGGGQGGGGTSPPIPPPNNPGTTFPGSPAGQTVCVSIIGGPVLCANTPLPKWLLTLLATGQATIIAIAPNPIQSLIISQNRYFNKCIIGEEPKGPTPYDILKAFQKPPPSGPWEGIKGGFDQMADGAKELSGKLSACSQQYPLARFNSGFQGLSVWDEWLFNTPVF